MPGRPAVPKNSAHTLHPYATVTPIEIRVSMVAARWRRFAQAAWWNGHAPQTATGEARVRASHCQLRTCSGAIIAIASTGTVNTAHTSSRVRSDRSAAAASSAPAAPPGEAVPGAGATTGGGTVAV